MTRDEALQVWEQVETVWPEVVPADASVVFDHLRDVPLIDAQAAVRIISDAGQGCPSLIGIRQLAGRLRREREVQTAVERRRNRIAALRQQLQECR